MLTGLNIPQLGANLLITMFFVAAWSTLASEVSRRKRVPSALLIGGFMGLASIAALTYSVPLGDGHVADLRAIPVSLAGLFGGPLAGMVALSMAAAARYWMGGAGAPAGVMSIALAGGVGIAGYYFCNRENALVKALLFSTALIILPAIPTIATGEPLQVIAVVAMFKFIGAVPAVYVLERAIRRSRERRLLDAAISVAPDYLYIKDPKSRFVAYNQGVADNYGSDRQGLIGKTDRDLVPGSRGRQLLADEQALLTHRGSFHGVIDSNLRDGQMRWFQSSKTLVTDADDQVIGLVGITRDITDERRQHKAVEDAAELWSLVLSQMADGVALFDRDANFVFCNEQHHRLFEATRDVRTPGVSLRHIIETGVARGAQSPPEGLTVDAWIDDIIEGLLQQRDEEMPAPDGGWLAIRNREIPGIGFVSVATDITAIRETQHDLAELTDRLTALAATDPLTGLANRRALDESFSREMARSERQNTWISAIMVDVDRFKRYNDLYGHAAGDTCLKRVAELMRSAAARPTDIVARYGGEEFCIILPETDEAGAMVIAERLRRAVMDAALPHAGSDTGIVTISLGMASYAPGQSRRTCEDLLIQADRALYTAKRAGRNQSIAGKRAA